MLRAYLTIWLTLTAVASVTVHACSHIGGQAPPPGDAARWAIASLEAARVGREPPTPPASARAYQAAGPVIALAWWRGGARARPRGGTGRVRAVQAAAERFSSLGRARDLPGWSAPEPTRFTLAVTLGEGPLMEGVPYLSELSVVPLVEGVSAELDGERAYLTPDELWSLGLYDSAFPTPIPDLTFGLDLGFVRRRLASMLGVAEQALVERGKLARLKAASVRAAPYPSHERLSAGSLERAAREGASFLLRHMRPDGSYSYVYDASRGTRLRHAGYSLPRHSGATYFLAQVDRVLGMPEAREGALRALDWVRREALTSCGGHPCVKKGDQADMGAAALTALAAAELLKAGDHMPTRDLLAGLNAFIRSMQREDGELMHVYDLRAQRPVDIQRLYFSGEAAYALLNAHRATADVRDLESARRLMTHLTGAGWSFFGSRYYYGEEHWTCQAVGEATGRLATDEALDFCLRWLEFQRAVQLGPGQTPWPADGAYGVGPIVVPRLTAVAARIEAGAQIYRAARDRGLPTATLRDQMERSLGVLLRMRWSPGPAHLMADPAGALGGIPATQASMHVRNDYVQHAGSAMLLWLEVLREEAARASAR